MKNTKKLLSLAMTLVLALALALPAFAATITVTNPVEGQTYSAYKIFDVTNSGDSYAYSIENTSAWYNTVAAYAATEGKGLTLAQVGNTAKYNVSVVTNTFNAADFAAALNAALKAEVASFNVDGAATAAKANDVVTAQITVGSAGYYFVDSSLGALCALNTTVGNIEITEKNEEPTIEKTVVNGGTSASVGDTVNYQIVVTAGGAADTTYVVHDKMSTGLTLNASSFSIKVGEDAVADRNYTIDTAPTDGCTFEIEFDQDYTAGLNKDTAIMITYSAVLNENAVTGTNGNTNEAILKYGNTSTVTTTTTTNTYEFDLVKTDGDKAVITGAQFKLYDAETGGNEIMLVKAGDGVYRPATPAEKTAENFAGAVIEAGSVTIKGLAAGTYYLEEIAAPEGYNLLTARVKVDVSANNKATVLGDIWSEGGIQVVNEAGALLPSTGGMGTTIFYTLGGLLAVGAVILLVTKKRMHDVEQ